jgi:hypothetical protein
MPTLLSQKQLENFAKQWTETLKRNLINKKKVASGNLVKSLDYRVSKVMNEPFIEIISNEYLQWVDKGRRPGKYPPIRPLANWARIKGIDAKAVFPIARNIFKFGIKPTNVIQATDRQMERQIDSSLAQSIADNMEVYVANTYINVVFDRKGQPWDANSPQGQFIMNMRKAWDLNL